ncbi:MAG: type II toxin-antitoxin system RelE/ParE family toxin [Ruminococcaceae bacterium]|nr:type II toxin-antitoxin system RelE/ParE family toxin [Oscillospiraceae bacterium]
MKYKVSLSPEAVSDLIEIKRYISEELENLASAERTIATIMSRLRQLEEFPYSGASLSSKIAVDTGYRYLVCGKYLAFYIVGKNDVVVDRVLYGARDYLRTLFGELTE